MKIYKFKLVRTSLLNNGVGDLETAVNQYSKDGWEFKTVLYFKEFTGFLLLVLEKSAT